MASKGYPFKEDFIYTTFNAYAAQITYQDYQKDPEYARMVINQWVEQKTHDKIQNLLSQSDVTEGTRLILVNALYFKAKWLSEFDENLTDTKSFALSNGSTTNVDMMHTTRYLNYYENVNFQMAELPYKDDTNASDHFSMILCLPKTQNNMNATQTTLFQSNSLMALLKDTNSTKVELSMPKFKTTWGSKSIKNLLVSLGFEQAFDGDLADFTSMWNRQEDENLYFTDVIHKAFIEVNEKETEAAAATAVIIGSTVNVPTEEPDPIVMNLNHPFLFFIIDKRNSLILFSGKIENPAKGI